MSLEFQIRHFKFYFIRGYPYFYQLGSPRSYRIKKKKFQCGCGAFISKGHKAEHPYVSKRHQKWLKTQ